MRELTLELYSRLEEYTKRMTGRRNFLRSLTSTISVPFLAQSQNRTGGASPMPAASDPAYWGKVRDQFLLARDKVFFNNGTIGAMPKVVFERTVDHLRKMATDLADWDYNPNNEWIAGYGPHTYI